jgi:hypothetical protein
MGTNDFRKLCSAFGGEQRLLQVLRSAMGSGDEIAAAIARCAGFLVDSVASEESIYNGKGSAIHYDGATSQVFFDHGV